MENKSAILSGPNEITKRIPENITLGVYFIDCLRKRSQEDIINIDANTGKVQTCKNLLEDVVKAVEVLKDLNIHKGDVLTIICENVIDYNVPVLAGFCLGVVVNLLNPDYLVEEIHHALIIAKPKIILSSAKALNNVQKAKDKHDFIQEVLLMGSTSAEGSTPEWEQLLNNVRDVNLLDFTPESFDATKQGALLLLSSGTTGLPKGVLLKHENIKYYPGWASDSRYCGFQKKDTMGLILPFFHIYGLLLYFTTIFVETKGVVFSKFQLQNFFKNIETHRINKLQVVPTLLSAFYSGQNYEYDLSSIDEILVGGASVENNVVEDLIQRFPNINFREVYGSTELGGASTFVTKFPKENFAVGHLIPFLEVKVCDLVTKKALGPMEVGELCFKGPMIAEQYIHNFGSETTLSQDGFYHSGDLGYYNNEDCLFIVDRVKELIKYKGFQVSPVELELLIQKHPSVKDCAVIGVPNKRAGQVALALVVKKATHSITENDIADFVAERISVNKRLHGGVRFVNEIPRAASGKILRRKVEMLIDNGV